MATCLKKCGFYFQCMTATDSLFIFGKNLRNICMSCNEKRRSFEQLKLLNGQEYLKQS